MKPKLILFLLLLCSFASYAQPMYSPEIRAKRETKWMTDSLHITTAQSEKVHAISLEYNQQMDKVAHMQGKQKDKEQQHLMNKKDKNIKALLDKEQYQKYYGNEKLARERMKIQRTGTHQPL